MILKNKTAILPAKIGLFGNNKEFQFSTSKSHRQVLQTKERNVILWRKRRKLGRVVVKESPLEKSKRVQEGELFIG